MIGIIDYNAGNIRSVERALQSLGIDYRISKKPADLEGADRLVFPGVGEAKFAMGELRATGFDSFIRDRVQAGVPLLGICLGTQIIFDHSEESDTPCLGLVPGVVRRFPRDFAGRALKVPHMGWNSLDLHNGGTALLDGVPEDSDFYFVHTYYIDPKDRAVITATTDYGMAVPCGVRYGSIEAFQFHPEKSGAAGLRILSNFARVTGGIPC